MPLTRRQNGKDPNNIISASWFNDFLDVLTGVMQDQAINIANTITAAALTITGKLSSDNGKFKTDGNGNLECGGKLGVDAAGDVLDASGYDTYVKARGGTNAIHFQS